jgi:Recombinase zinc beta ribbon domain
MNLLKGHDRPQWGKSGSILARQVPARELKQRAVKHADACAGISYRNSLGRAFELACGYANRHAVSPPVPPARSTTLEGCINRLRTPRWWRRTMRRIVDGGIWAAVAARRKERTTGERSAKHRPRRYLLSGLLVCERCGCRMIVTGSNGSHCGCATHRQGGASACPVSQQARRDLAEHAVLEPIRRELLEPEAVDLACRLIRECARAELMQVESEVAPAVAVIAKQIAELEDLITSRGSLAVTLRPVVAELREKMSTLQRVNWRKAQGIKVAEIPAEEAYRAAVADMAATLGGSNVEAARAALRGLTGEIPVFEHGGKLYGRLSVDAVPLFAARCNPGLIEQVGSGGPLVALFAANSAS